jgi:HAD superfamily hydrolase (TIGR01484 family)
MKKLIVFDLDDTLAPSKSPVDDEMATLLSALLGVAKVAVITGGAMPQIEKQVVARLPAGHDLANLSLLPTCGTSFFAYHDGWTNLYAENFSEEQKTTIVDALNKAVDESGFRATQTWGEQIEDRQSQITYSALGQQAPLDAKKQYDPDFAKRQKIKAILDPLLPNFSVHLGGSSSIDVTLPGIDKAYGIRKLVDVLKIPIEEILFVGDALFPGGNDAPVRSTGTDCIQVRDPNETKRVIEAVVACMKAPSASH